MQKYTMSDEEYKARENTYWRYKEEKLKVHFASNVCHGGLQNMLFLVLQHDGGRLHDPQAHGDPLVGCDGGRCSETVDSMRGFLERA